jgi:hypothetical protein
MIKIIDKVVTMDVDEYNRISRQLYKASLLVQHILAMGTDVHFQEHPEWEYIVMDAQTLADLFKGGEDEQTN